MRLPEAPLYNDPIYNGAADPVVIWNTYERQRWMVYTQRMASAPGPGVTWVHGSKLGAASSPDGHNWLYRGELEGLEFEHGHNSFWAPEIVYHAGVYHMYVSYVQGMPTDWNRPRTIIHYTSTNLWTWQFEDKLKLSSDRVIDACVARLPQGGYRMWYKDEDHGSHSYYADSTDLYRWESKGCAIDMDAHEGPNVFRFRGAYWMVADFWRGQGVFRSSDCTGWTHTGFILDRPGKRAGDQTIGNHADVVVTGDEAYIFYFAHPDLPHDDPARKFTSVQVARLYCDGSTLTCDRDEEFDLDLPNGEAYLEIDRQITEETK